MIRSESFNVNELIFHQPCSLSAFTAFGRIAALLWLVFTLSIAIQAQGTIETPLIDRAPLVVDGVSDSTVFGLGRSLKVTGTVKEGAVAFGGDVIVQGIVEGDVAAIGGSVIQLEGARIGGDVIVVGGVYRHSDRTPNRDPNGMTIMYAGYEQELRDMMRNPSGLLTPRWSPMYIGLRLLSILFWFVVSWILTAIMPGAVSRGTARLQMTSLRVAAIGFLSSIVIGVGVDACLWLLPSPFNVLFGIMALFLILVAALFGRVIIYAATGRWLQRRYMPVGKKSESVALLVGTTFWVVLSSLPYVWPFVVAAVLVMSLGITLTGRYRSEWKRAEYM